MQQANDAATMNRELQELDIAGGWVAEDIRMLIVDSESLLAAAVEAAGGGLEVLQAQFEVKLRHARDALAHAVLPALDSANEAVVDADRYVRRNAWAVIGIATFVAMIIGMLSVRR